MKEESWDNCSELTRIQPYIMPFITSINLKNISERLKQFGGIIDPLRQYRYIHAPKDCLYFRKIIS